MYSSNFAAPPAALAVQSKSIELLFNKSISFSDYFEIAEFLITNHAGTTCIY